MHIGLLYRHMGNKAQPRLEFLFLIILACVNPKCASTHMTTAGAQARECDLPSAILPHKEAKVAF